MATDNTHLTQSGDVAPSTAQEFNPEVVQVAQADAGATGNGAQPAPIPGVPGGEVQVQIPAGQTVVRVQIAPGETIDLPFDGALAAKFGEQGNLAVKVGDQTIILLGYAEANQQEGVTLKDAKGHAIDVATVIAQTDPNLDIQTAAGPAAGPAGQGGHLFHDFNPGAGLGGFGELNVIDPTQLQYGLIQPDEKLLVVAEEPGTTEVPPTIPTPPADVPEAPSITILSVDNSGTVNEDDFHHNGGIVTEALVIGGDENGASQGLQDQLAGDSNFTLVQFGNHQDGNDPYDTTDKEDGSQNDPALPDNGTDSHGRPLDQDREPLSTTAHIGVNFQNGPGGTLTFDHNGQTPIIDNLAALVLTSHGHTLSYELLPATATHGESIVAYYTQGDIQVVVFSLEIQQPHGAANGNFDITFTTYGTLDNTGQGIGLDSFDLSTVFFANADGGPTTESNGALVFHDIDDVPELGHYSYSTGNGDDSGSPVNGTDTAVQYHPANLTIGIDETQHTQHTSYQADVGTKDAGDIDPTGALGQHKGQHTDDFHTSLSDTNSLVEPGLGSNTTVSGLISSTYFINGDATQGFQSYMGAAHSFLDVSFGADGNAEGNDQAGKTIFTNDGTANATAFQLYMQEGAAAPSIGEGVLTNVWIDVDNGDGTFTREQVTAYQLDANTIIGIAPTPEGVQILPPPSDSKTEVDVEGQNGNIPVFVLHLDPTTGELTLVQYHSVENADGSKANDPTLILDADGNQLIHFRATDYDGDHVDAPLEVAIIDDAPRICKVTYCSDGTNDHDKGHVDEDYLHSNTNGVPGNHDHDTSPDNLNADYGTHFKNDGDGPGHTHVTGQIDVQSSVDAPLKFEFNVGGLTKDGDSVASFTDASGHTVTSPDGLHNVGLTLTQSGNDWVITGAYSDASGTHTVFTVDLNSVTGDFTFDLQGALGHPDHGPGPITSYEDDLGLNFGAKVTDADGSPSTTVLQFVVDDDHPTIVCQPVIDCTISSDPHPRGEGECLSESTCSVSFDIHDKPSWVCVTATDDKGGAASFGTSTGAGFGVDSDTDGNGQDRFHEINYDNAGGIGGTGGSESLTFGFGGHLVESATIELARFYSGENGVGDEQGHWAAYKGDVLVAEGYFTANSSTGQFGLSIPTVAGGFDSLVFTATAGTALSGNTGDESDYLVQELHLNLLPTDKQSGHFTYEFGADGGVLPSGNASSEAGLGLQAHYEGASLTSDGHAVTVTESVVNGHIMIEGTVAGPNGTTLPVFTMDVNPGTPDPITGVATASYTYEQYAPLDNNHAGSNLPFQFVVTDRDGDATSTEVCVCLKDAAPTVGETSANVFEKGLDQSGTDHDGTAKGDGSNTTTGFLNFSYNGDGPGKVTDINDGHGHQGQDDHNGHLVLNTDQYTLTVDEKTGYYTFTLKQNLDHNDSSDDGYTNSDGTNSTTNPQDILQDLNISYTVEDADHSTATGNLVVHVTDDGPIATCDTFSDITLTSSAPVLVGNVLTNDQFGADGKHVNYTTHASEPIVGVTVDGVDGHKNNTGGYDVTLSNGTVHVSQAGDVTFDPIAGINYGNGHTFNLTYTIEDGDGDTSTTTDHFTVKGGNLVPVNVADAVTVTDETNNSNVMIVFDHSGSMNDDPNVNGFDHRIDLARAALNDLLEKYGENGDVRVMIVDFSSSAGSMDHWGTIAEAEAYLNTLHADGNTNYSAAVAQAQSAWDLSGKGGADYGNYVYFLSDGKPTTGGEGNDHHLSSSQKDDWDSFLEGHNISNVYAVGVGADISANDQDLNAVADPDNHNNPPGQVIVADDEGKLAADLTHTVQAAVHGNVLDGSLSNGNGADTPGNGPAHVSSFSHGTQVLSWDGSGAVLQTGGATSGVTINGTDVTIVTDKGTMVFHFADGTFDYTPKVVDASTSDVFHYVTTDSDGDIANGADLTVNINHVNHVPIAVDDSFDTSSGSLTIDVSQLLANDSDPDHDALKITSVGGSTKGNVSLNDDQIIFTPTGSGQGGFTYTVSDGHGGITTGHVVIDINATPTAKDVSFSGNEDTSKINVTLSGSDSDGSVSFYHLSDLPTNGKLYTDSSMTHLAVAGTDYASNNFYFKPDANFNGDVSFHYTVVDNHGAVDATPATVNITVNSVNDAPDTDPATATGNENTTTPIAITFSGTDIDGSVAGYRLTGNLPTNGTLYLNADGTGAVHTGQTYGQNTFYFVPNTNFSGVVTFNYAAVDNNGAIDASAALATITINHVNDLPVAANDHVYTNIADAFTLESAWLTANDSDGDGDPLHVASVVAAANLAATPGTDANHNVTGVDISSTSKDASFDYHVNDGQGSSANAGHVTVTYDGTTGNDHTLNGGNGNDIIVHTGIGHTINGNDGADLIADLGSGNTIHGGDGNDHIQVASLTDVMDGGDNDSNNMATNGNQGDVLDLSHLSGSSFNIHNSIGNISHIETLDATDTHNQTISLRASDVIEMSDGTFNPNANNLPTQDAIKVEGNTGDTLKLDDSNGKWFDVTNTVGNAPADHHVYAYDSTGGGFTASQVTAYVIVSNNVTVHDHNDGAVGAP